MPLPRRGHWHHSIFSNLRIASSLGCAAVLAPAFDLQAHSTCSDGALAPRAVVSAAAAAGVELLALTDHDTVDGVDEALEAGAAFGGRVVPAAELSAVEGDREGLHVLRYPLPPPTPP